MDAFFLPVLIGYAVAGLACIVIAAIGLGGTNRLATGLIGLASIGYAGYLLLSSGEVVFFPFAVLVPVLTVVSAVRNQVAGGPRLA